MADTPSVNAPHRCEACGVAASSASLGLSGVPCARNWMPNRLAASTAFSAPTRSSSGTKYVLADRPKPSHIVRLPFIHDGLALTGQ